MSWRLAIPSAGRAGKVKALGIFPGKTPLVVVPPDEQGAYGAAYPNSYILAQHDPGISGARNAILDSIQDGSDILMLDDDVSAIGTFDWNGHKVVVKPWTGRAAVELVDHLFAEAARYKSPYWGVSPTGNPLNFRPRHLVVFNLFVNGSMSGYAAHMPLRFDLDMPLKEDYDFTVTAYLRYGRVARFDLVWAKAVHRTNTGGACEYRTSETEQRAIAHLRSKWGPEIIRPHPRKRDEISLRLKNL